MKVANLLSELRRRRVFRVAAAYAVAGWLVIQISEATFPAFGIPDWAMRLLVLLVVLGFPVALVLAWAFDLTPSGVERTRSLVEAPAPGIQPSGSPEARSRQPHPHSVAVLPFVNMGGKPEDEYFSDGITEDLIAHLAGIRELRVISRTSVMRYKGTTKSVPEIAGELAVAHLLEGSVRRVADRLRIVAQLIDARTDHHLWAETYDRDWKDIFEIQAEVSRRIASALRAKLSAREERRIGAAPTVDMAAYDLYLRGRHEWNKRTDVSLDSSVSFLEKAVASDPGFALAHAARADSYLMLGVYGTRAPNDVMPLAREAADTALAIDAEQPEALTALAGVRAVYDWDWAGSERDFRRAIELGPNYALAHHWYASHLLMPCRRFEDARAELERAKALDPVSPAILTMFAILEYFQGRFDEAAGVCQAVLRSHDDFWLAYYFLGLSRLHAGSPDASFSPLIRARDLSAGAIDAVAALGYAYGIGGRREEARAVLRELEDRAADSYVSAVRLAQLYVALDRPEEAIVCLRSAVEARASGLIWLDVQPIYRPLRGKPAFEALRARVFGDVSGSTPS